jgi:TolB protein
MDRLARNRKRLTSNRAIDTSPTWSPDGKQISFTSNRDGTPQIYVMDADGSNQRRLTYVGGDNRESEWSPIGNRISFTTRGSDGSHKICIMYADGTGARLLPGQVGNNEH